VDSLQGLYPYNIDAFSQAPRQHILMRGIARDKTHQKIPATPYHMTFTRLGPRAYLSFKSFQHTPLLTIEADKGIKIERPSKKIRINFGMVAFDDPMLFKTANTPETRGRRNASSASQLNVGHSTVSLQLSNDLPVNGI